MTTEAALYVPAGPHRAEITIRNSRFIASAGPAFSPEEARGFIRRIKEEFKDASHNVPAFIIGHGSSVIEHGTDDGEPFGTAGRPALTVLRGSGLGDIVVVVTRYFGGVKLGKGGLARAYTDAVKTVLEDLPLARKLTTDLLEIKIEYSIFDRLRQLVDSFNASTISEEFTEKVTVRVRIDSSTAGEFETAVQSLALGKAGVRTLEKAQETVLPYHRPENR